MRPVNITNPRTLWILIFTLGILLYANTLNHGFVFDDNAVLKENSFVQRGLGGLGDIFTKGSWDGYDASADMHIYRPLQLSFLALQYELFGLDPFGYHAVQIITYALTCCLIFGLLRRLFGDIEHGTMLAFLTALIYTAHPVHTEVVANIKGNGDLLALLLGVASLTCLWKHSQTKSAPQLAAGATLFLMALLMKETIVCFVGVAALMLYFFTQKSIKRILLSLTPMLAMVVIYLGMRALVFGDSAQSLTQTTQYDNYVLMAEGLSQMLGLRLYALGKDLQLCIAPYPLQFMYVYDSVPMVEFWDIRSGFSLVAYALLGIACVLNFKKRNIWGFAIGYFGVTLALFTNTFFSIPNILSERWLLPASLGPSIAIAYAIMLLWKIEYKTALGIMSLILVGYGGYTMERNAAWKSNLTLLETDIRTAPRNAMTNRFLATLYLSAAENAEEPEVRLQKLQKAAFYQERFIELAPNDAAQHYKLGKIYQKLSKHRKAAECFKKVAGYISPLQEEAELLYAKNANMGGLYQDALQVWVALREREPESIEIATGYTVALLKTGDKQKAEDSFSRLLSRIQGGNAAPARLNQVGIELEEMGAYPEAARTFGLAASYQSPIQGKAEFSRAKNLNLAKLYSQAVPFWRELDRKYPALFQVKLNMTTALIDSGNQAEALKAAQALRPLLKKKSSDKLSAEDCKSVNAIAVSLERMGANELAASFFLEASKYDSPIKGKAAFSVAKNLYAAGKYLEALKQWEIIGRDYPSVSEVAFRKAATLEAMGREDAARAVYKTIMDQAASGSTTANEKDYNRALRQLNNLN